MGEYETTDRRAHASRIFPDSLHLNYTVLLVQKKYTYFKKGKGSSKIVIICTDNNR